MKIAVIGGNGQLGSDVVAAFARHGDEPAAVTHQDLEIADVDAVRCVLDGIRPELVVNTAAMHQVERCEEDPQQCFGVNAVGARNLAIWCCENAARMIHVSTDYVFDGLKQAPYVETDPPRPLNVYGNAKLAGEHFVTTTAERHFVLRTSGLYGKQPCRGKGLNFVELMLKLAREREEVRVVEHERLTPTSTAELARQIVALGRSDAWGTYHATAQGECSWFEFAAEIFALRGIETRLTRAAADEFPAKVPRPTYSVLDNRGLARLGLDVLEPWQYGLAHYFGVGQYA